MFGSCAVDSKEWFYSLATCGRPLNDTIDALYHDFVENGKDFSAIPEKHEVEEYIRGFYCDPNIPWNKVDYMLFPVYVPWEKSELGHWILGVFDFTDWCIYVYDSNRTRHGDKVVQKLMLPYQTLIPYFLKKVNLYLEEGIVKSENDTLPIKMVDELPQQTQCDCGAFICAFAEYVIHDSVLQGYLDVCLLPSITSLFGGLVIRSFMLSGTIYDVVLPTGRISPWSNTHNRGTLRGHYRHVNQMENSFNTNTSDCEVKCIDRVYEEKSHHVQHSRQSNLHLYGNDLYDDTNKSHTIHDAEDNTLAPKQVGLLSLFK
ncbi:hypothetical protein CQW23_17079 [Capsicum baccatum]|uniref:Ubiquitin-like protease family profile domain-containing protein n=1 Tax=Capsicum baccatum TaxID=33114 RepID=A0A2G2WCS0_CAPBA|nr:hypothetical protein CQW23_17079 [Capsicum baccatum]